MAALEEDARKKEAAAHKTIEEIREMISTLENTVKDIEGALGSSDILFLQVGLHMFLGFKSNSIQLSYEHKCSLNVISLSPIVLFFAEH